MMMKRRSQKCRYEHKSHNSGRKANTSGIYTWTTTIEEAKVQTHNQEDKGRRDGANKRIYHNKITTKKSMHMRNGIGKSILSKVCEASQRRTKSGGQIRRVRRRGNTFEKGVVNKTNKGPNVF